MPRYEYKCPRGHQFEVVRSMDDHRRRERCPKCRRMAPQVFTPTTVRTDDNNPLRNMKPYWGIQTETRAEVKALEARGIGIVNKHDMEYYERRRGRTALEPLKEEIRRDEQRQTIRVQTTA